MLNPKHLDAYPHGYDGFRWLGYAMLGIVLTALTVNTVLALPWVVFGLWWAFR